MVLGKHGDVESPLKPLTPLTLLDIKIPGGASFSYAAPKGWNSFLLVLSGAGTAGTENVAAPALSAISFEVQGDTVDFKAVEDTHFVIAAGEPINQRANCLRRPVRCLFQGAAPEIPT